MFAMDLKKIYLENGRNMCVTFTLFFELYDSDFLFGFFICALSKILSSFFHSASFLTFALHQFSCTQYSTYSWYPSSHFFKTISFSVDV